MKRCLIFLPAAGAHPISLHTCRCPVCSSRARPERPSSYRRQKLCEACSTVNQRESAMELAMGRASDAAHHAAPAVM
eukprot:5598496-Pyramimonas_sp.AAC.1